MGAGVSAALEDGACEEVADLAGLDEDDAGALEAGAELGGKEAVSLLLTESSRLLSGVLLDAIEEEEGNEEEGSSETIVLEGEELSVIGSGWFPLQDESTAANAIIRARIKTLILKKNTPRLPQKNFCIYGSLYGKN